MNYTVANVDPQLNSFGDELGQIFTQAGAQLIEKECVTEEEVLELAGEADAVIASRAPISAKVVTQMKNCKVIGRPGAGTDNVDHQAATQHGMVVVYVPDFCTEEVSNHALMFLLACHKKLGALDKFVRNGKWGFELLPPLPALGEQILGMVGFGRIARCLARKAQGLGMRVLAYDPFLSAQTFTENKVQQASLEQILKSCDYVSLHIPLTEKTEALIGKPQLQMMKPTAYLINCARGGVVDEEALIEALKNKTIAGAGLDCLAQEPPSGDNALFAMDNVIFTPHSAAYSDAAIAYLRKRVAQQVVDVLQGKKPEFVRNPEVLDKVDLK